MRPTTSPGEDPHVDAVQRADRAEVLADARHSRTGCPAAAAVIMAVLLLM